MKDKNIELFLDGIKEIKDKIISIYLFGSRAKKSNTPYSDYDLLLVVKDKKIKDKIYNIAVDIFLKTGADLSFKIFKEKDFTYMRRIKYPFIKNIIKEGIRIG